MTQVVEATAYKIFDFWSTVYILEINPDAFASFVRQVGDGYLPNPYLNALHAADVLQYCHLFLLKGLKVQPVLSLCILPPSLSPVWCMSSAILD
jgi:hypothetical protein